jgi:Chemoreceptor zinc-binding domain
MDVSGIKGEINAAIEAHDAWKVRLQDAIAGKCELSAGDAKNPTLCQFGQWLYGPTIPKVIRDTSDFQAVQRLHARFHDLAADIIGMSNRGHSEQASLHLGGDYATTSANLIESLKRF